MAKQKKQTKVILQAYEGGLSAQDLLMAGMSPEQIRRYRQQAMRLATKQGNHASAHNEAQKQLEHAIHTGERLTNATLQKLIDQARSQAGIDAGELLDFTLGKTKLNSKLSQMSGLANSMTPAVLGLYVANVQKAAKAFIGGISARQVINQSRPVDIKRANEQIFLATPFKRQGNQIYWLTNAGPNSDAQNHKVVTELLGYPSLMVGRSTLPDRRIIKELLEHGKIKFDCDCGRHRYWYRYIATIGKFNFGAHENRYPSTRNPQLTGVACKHVLRVMHTLISGYGVEKVRGYIKADLARGTGRAKSERMTAAQIRQEAQRQSEPRVAEHWRKRIERKIKEQAKLAFKQLGTTTELQTYYRAKKLYEIRPDGLSQEMVDIIRKYEARGAPMLNGRGQRDV